MKMDLKGLKIAWAGMLLSIIASAISGSGSGNSIQALENIGETTASSGTNVLSSIGGAIGLVAFILMIVGLSRLKDVSDHFRKARNLQIIMFIVAIVFVVVIVIALVMFTVVLGAETGIGALSICMTLMIIMIVLLLIFGILFYRNLLRGCNETAYKAGDDELAVKFKKMWKTFLTGIILTAAGSIVMIIGVISLIGTGIAGAADAVVTQSLIVITPGVIIMVVGAIFMLVFTILLLVRMALLFAYDGKEISEYNV